MRRSFAYFAGRSPYHGRLQTTHLRPLTKEAGMPRPQTPQPYGSWASPITAAALVEGSRGLGAPHRDGDHLYWLESRPAQGGRMTIMRRREGSEPEELLPEPFNARSRVQEYGGGSLLVAGGRLWFSNYADQRLYRFTPGEAPVAVTPAAELRFAGCRLDAARGRLICIREDHRVTGEPVNSLVALPLDGISEGEVLFSGTDFVSAPRMSPDGSRIAFTTWMHPNMPWDNTRLHSAGFDAAGELEGLVTHNPDRAESVTDPQWRDDNQLFALSDRDNWWRPYSVTGETFTAVPTGLEESEIGGPDWSIDRHYYHFLASGELLVNARRGSVETLHILDGEGGQRRLDTGAVSYSALALDGERLYVTAGFAEQPTALIAINQQGERLAVLRRSQEQGLDHEWVPGFAQVSFPVADAAVAHGVYLAPKNPHARGPQGEAPPLIVSVHGGPTASAGVSYNPRHYYWTSRGFAVLDLNYRGSAGFGRDYRQALYGNWGLADVQDAVAGARWLAEQGLADPGRLIIRGGSAGGYTTLAAHAFHETFAAGASYYGVSDIEALAKETHKFESRYLDQLIGPYPERRDLYVARSPIHHLASFKAPLILLQGLEDPIVPANQSEAIYRALREGGVPTAYIAYEGESHGFRKAENQIASLEAELYFYGQVLGFAPADDLPAIVIDNLEGAAAWH